MEKSSCEFYLEIHVERKWVDGDSERSVTQYVANTTKISLVNIELSNEQHTYMLSRDKKIPLKQMYLNSIEKQDDHLKKKDIYDTSRSILYYYNLHVIRMIKTINLRDAKS